MSSSEEEEQEEVYEVESISGHRVKKNRIEYRIHWQGYSSEQDTWEPESNLVGCEELLAEYKKEHDVLSLLKKPKEKDRSSIEKLKSFASDEEGEEDDVKRKEKKHKEKRRVDDVEEGELSDISGPTARTSTSSKVKEKKEKKKRRSSGDTDESHILKKKAKKEREKEKEKDRHKPHEGGAAQSGSSKHPHILPGESERDAQLREKKERKKRRRLELASLFAADVQRKKEKGLEQGKPASHEMEEGEIDEDALLHRGHSKEHKTPSATKPRLSDLPGSKTMISSKSSEAKPVRKPMDTEQTPKPAATPVTPTAVLAPAEEDDEDVNENDVLDLQDIEDIDFEGGLRVIEDFDPAAQKQQAQAPPPAPASKISAQEAGQREGTGKLVVKPEPTDAMKVKTEDKSNEAEKEKSAPSPTEDASPAKRSWRDAFLPSSTLRIKKSKKAMGTAAPASGTGSATSGGAPAERMGTGMVATAGDGGGQTPGTPTDIAGDDQRRSYVDPFASVGKIRKISDPLSEAVDKLHLVTSVEEARTRWLEDTKRSASKVTYNELREAVNSGDSVLVARALAHDECPELNQGDPTLLMTAAKKGYADIVGMLVRRGAEVNHQNSEGMTALMFAVESGNLGAASVLINSGAYLNVINSRSETALTRAVKRGHRVCVELLVRCGANFNAMSSTPKSAMHLAKQMSHKEIEAILTNGITQVQKTFTAEIVRALDRRATLLNAFFPLHVLSLCEAEQFLINFSSEAMAVKKGEGNLLFLGNAVFRRGEVRCLLGGECYVEAAIVNGVEQQSLTPAGYFVLSLSPLTDGENQLVINTKAIPDFHKTKLLVWGFRIKLS